jgi:Na+/H+ antiporter NhaB
VAGGNNWQPSDPDVARLLDRVRAVEAEVDQWENRQQTARTEHRTRNWQIALVLLSGLVLPLASLGIIALIHFVTKS